MKRFGFGVTRGNTGTWYFVGCGLAMAMSGWLFLKGLRLALPVYALTCPGLGRLRIPHLVRSRAARRRAADDCGLCVHGAGAGAVGVTSAR